MSKRSHTRTNRNAKAKGRKARTRTVSATYFDASAVLGHRWNGRGPSTTLADVWEDWA